MMDRWLLLASAEGAEAVQNIAMAALQPEGETRVLRLGGAAWAFEKAAQRVRLALGQEAASAADMVLPPGIAEAALHFLQHAVAMRRPPDFIVGGKADPYLRRWFVVPRNETHGNVYLHQFLRSDDDRALHDHPWDSVSIVLSGGYDEMLDGGVVVKRRVGDVVVRQATAAHRVILPAERKDDVWTLFVTGPKVRDWGFWCPQGWVPWQEFVAEDDRGNIGRGCGS